MVSIKRVCDGSTLGRLLLFGCFEYSLDCSLDYSLDLHACVVDY